MLSRAAILFLTVLLLSPACSGETLKTIENTLAMKLVLVPAGEFLMGSDESLEAFVKAYPQYERRRYQ